MKITKISQFSKDSNILSSDLFLMSRSVDNNNIDKYASYAINYNSLSNLFIGYFQNYSISARGEWRFKENNNQNYLTVKKESITKLSSVVSYEYARDYYLNKLSALFEQLYGSQPWPGYDNNTPTRAGTLNKLKLPSYVGYILISKNINSESTLQSIYGEKTRWKKIGGRMLIGVGANEKNNNNDYGSMTAGVIRFTNKKMGGSNEAELVDLPAHSHSFSGVKFGKYPSKTFGFTLDTEFNMELIQVNGHPSLKHHHSTGSYVVRKGATPQPDVMLGGKRDSKSFTYSIRGTVHNNESKNLTHNNMPPYIGYYIWERTE